MIFTHPVFKHSKFVCLSHSDQTNYLMFKTKHYFNSKNRYAPDTTGHSQVIWNNQVSVNDFYNEITALFSDKYTFTHKTFVSENAIRLGDTLRRLLKIHDLEKSFGSCFDTFLSPIYDKLKKEALEKKHAEALRVSLHLQMEKEQEMAKQQEKLVEKEKQKKIDDFKKMVLDMGAEWEEEEEEEEDTPTPTVAARNGSRGVK